jgi:hypothetical protein
MICAAPDGGASISLLMGAMSVAAVSKIDIEAGDRRWSTAGEPGATPVTLGQAFETAEKLDVDVTDETVNAIVARLRIAKASEAEFHAAAGTLWIGGIGAWPVICDGP